ncbi:MAG: hypothetical protein N2109_09875 [Fimbriimonadales bacterium]|nr:hypothetical protein [Fimbriimonadales bacterium]
MRDPATSFAALRRRFLHQKTESVDRLIRRAEVQLRFARNYAGIQPEPRRSEWLELAARAEALLDALPADPQALAEGLRQAEGLLAPVGRAAKGHTVWCVGHGHIDMNWMWSWPETVAATHDTFASVLRLMREVPDLTYSQSQASVYDLVERHFPEMFEEIRQRVAEGRWEVTAVHWVEGDKNLASGEALCRHLLLTRRYFQEKFGLQPEDVPIDWEPDTFGHANTIPSFLARAGVRYYYCCRPGGGDGHVRTGSERPPVFWWQAPDGSRVLVNYEQTWYNSYVLIGEDIAEPLVRFVQRTGFRDWMNVYGLGNHGGGPTRAEVAYLLEMREWPIYPNVRFGTVKGYLDGLLRQAEEEGIPIPVLDHELNFEFTGCYTSQSLIKQANRFAENQLLEAEALATMASRLEGMPYPADRLREAWTKALFNHFHDILPGSGVRETREHAMGNFQDAAAACGAVKRRAGNRLFSGIDTASLLPDDANGRAERERIARGEANPLFEAGPGCDSGVTGFSMAATGGRWFRPFVLFNPCAWDRRDVVVVRIYDPEFDVRRLVARDADGRCEPALLLEEGDYWGHRFARVAFVAEVPALGYATVLLGEGSSDLGGVEGGPWAFMVDGSTRVAFDRHGSGLSELSDPSWMRPLATPHGPRFGEWRFVEELPQGMNAWVLGGLLHQGQPLKTLGADWLCNGRIGLVRRRLEVPGTASRVELIGWVAAGVPGVRFQAEIDWREIGDGRRTPSLVVGFPLPDRAAGAVYETPFGSVWRPSYDGAEVPSLRFAHPVPPIDGGGGYTLVQDCKYGHALRDEPTPELTLRMVRSSHEPDHAPEVAKTTVRYGVIPHADPPSRADLARLGAAFNHPILAFPAEMAEGSKPCRRSWLRCETDNVLATCLKAAEDGRGTIVRLTETEGTAAAARLRLDPCLGSRAETVDLLERPTAGSAAIRDGVLEAEVPAHGIVTLRLT